MSASLFFAALGAIALIWFGIVILFTPAIPYHMRQRLRLDSAEYLHLLSSLSPAEVFEGNKVTVLKNGDAYYPAMLEAIGGATRSVTFESYIFKRGLMRTRFIDALPEKARPSSVHLTMHARWTEEFGFRK